MEQYDSHMAQRVWNRVWSENTPAREELGHLWMCEAQLFADYTKLLRRFPEIKPLLRDTRRHMACLRGIRYMTGGSVPAPIPAKPRTEKDEITLQRCCAQCLKTGAAYDAQSGDPEYGFCFARMAEETRQHCRILLEHIGNVDK